MMFTTEQAILRKYSDENRLWQGIPGIEVTRNGRMYVAFYSGGIKEEIGNYVLLYSSDDGKNFSLLSVVLPDAGERCFDPCLWIDPLDRLWVIWNCAPSNRVCAVICHAPDASVPVFAEERVIGTGVMMNKPTVTSGGEWLFPIAVWDHGVDTGGIVHKLSAPAGSYVCRSIDCGASFVPYGYADVPKRSFDEHMVIELSGGILQMFVRTKYGIGTSYSYDGGKTWTHGIDSTLGGPCSRFCIRRLKSGRLILINHVNFRGRNNLTAMLSDDDGKTFPYKLLLDGRNEVSYPDLKEAEDGYIYIVYDRERGAYKHSMTAALGCAREILYARITEQDILHGNLSEDSALQIVINKLGEYRGEPDNPYKEPDKLSDRMLAQTLIAEGKHAIDKLFDLYPISCINLKNLNYTDLDNHIDNFHNSGSRDIEKLEWIIKLVRRAAEDGETSPMVKSTIAYIEAHFAEEFTVAEYAKMSHCSYYHLCHEFKAATGLTMIDFKNKVRLANAKSMLFSTDMTISQISACCGYGSESYFCKVFLSEENITPSEYRKNIRGRK